MRLSSRVVVCGALALIVATSPLAAKAELAPETRARIDEMASRPVRNGEVPGLIVGVMQGSDRMIRGYGESVEGSGVRPTKDTIWEIGSITKTFTAMLLALYVQRGVVHYDDPLQKYVPDWVTVPSYQGRQIKLIDLATHTSGLPKDPILRGRDHLSVEEMYRMTSAYQLTRPPGERFEYSNWGFALLAHALMRATGEDYEQLVESNICAPLGLLDTRINLAPDEVSREAQGYSPVGIPKPHDNTTWPAFNGAGALRSTMNDMMIYLAYNMGQANTPLSSLLPDLQRHWHAAGVPGAYVGLAWQMFPMRGTDHQVIWKNGAASGFFSYIGFVKETGTGVVVIANRKVKVGKIAIQILRMLNGANIIEPEPVEEPEESSAK
jgi:D-alanyl-D-alanine-carboxypeptidase/D-alanyl-D-alanine-endopeptidase